tara:strand:+ start:974 stop:4879 length:3906 start_codon:yes stop_codon:yes gene_type:complete
MTNVKRTPKKMKNMVGGSLETSQGADYRLNTLQESEFIPYTSSILSIGKKDDDRKKRERDELLEKQEKQVQKLREMEREADLLKKQMLDQERAVARAAAEQSGFRDVMAGTVQGIAENQAPLMYTPIPKPEDFNELLGEQERMNEKLRTDYDRLVSEDVALDQEHTAEVMSIKELSLPPLEEEKKIEELKVKHEKSKKGIMDSLDSVTEGLTSGLAKLSGLTRRKRTLTSNGSATAGIEENHKATLKGATTLAGMGDGSAPKPVIEAARNLVAVSQDSLSGEQGKGEAQRLSIARRRFREQTANAANLPDQGEGRELIAQQQELNARLKQGAMELERMREEQRRAAEAEERKLRLENQKLDAERKRIADANSRTQAIMIRDQEAAMRQIEREAELRALTFNTLDPKQRDKETEKANSQLRIANEEIKRLSMDLERSRVEASNDRERAEYQRLLKDKKRDAARLEDTLGWLDDDNIPRPLPGSPSPPQSPAPSPPSFMTRRRRRREKRDDERPSAGLERQLRQLVLYDEEPLPESEDEGYEYDYSPAPLDPPTLSPLSQKQRDILAEQNVIRIQNEIASLKRRTEEAKMQKEQETMRRLIKEQQEMDRQLKEEQRLVDEERERGTIPFHRRQELADAAEGNVEMAIAGLQSSQGDSAEKTRKMEEYLNLQEELKQLKEKNRRQAQRNQQTFRRDDYDSPAPLDLLPPTRLPQEDLLLIQGQNTKRIQNEIASLKRRKEEAELQNQQAILRKMIEEQEEMDRQLKEEQRRDEREKQQQLALQPQRRQNLLTSAIINADRERLHAQSRLKDDIIAGTSSGPNMKRLEETKLELQRLKELEEKLRLESERNLQDMPSSQPMRPDVRNLIEGQAIVRLQDELADLKAEQELAEKLNQIETMNAIIKEQQEKKRQLEEEQRNLDRYRDSEEQIPPHHQQRLIQDAMVNLAKKNTEVEQDDGGYSEEQMRDFEENKRVLKKLQEIQEELFKQNQPDPRSPLLIKDRQQHPRTPKRGSESKHKQLARQFDKKAEEDRQREAQRGMADKDHQRGIQDLTKQAADGDESAQKKLENLDTGVEEERQNAANHSRLRKKEDAIAKERERQAAEEELRAAQEEHDKKVAAREAAILREREERKRIADEKAKKEKLAAEEAAREKKREEERAQEEERRRKDLKLIESKLDKKYKNLIINKYCRETFMKIFKKACDYMRESSKVKGDNQFNHKEIIDDAKKAITISQNSDIFINALECISLMVKNKGGFEHGSDREAIYSNIKESDFGEFFNYLKYKKYKIYTDDCILTEKQKIPD